MSSISRRRNGLMAFSVIGGPVLGEVLGPSISRQDARFPLLSQLSSRHKLPRERFSPAAQPRRRRSDWGRTAVHPFEPFTTGQSGGQEPIANPPTDSQALGARQPL